MSPTLIVESDPHPASTARGERLQHWLQQVLKRRDFTLSKASSDASFRRYLRVQWEGQSRILMDAPPDREDSRSFVQIAGWLRDWGLNAPEVLAEDLEQGFLLLEDLGEATYLQALQQADTRRVDELYSDAIEALVRMQVEAAQDPRCNQMPIYDAALLRSELGLFPDWYVKHHLGHELKVEQRRQWDKVCDLLVNAALKQPRVFVHRDYMPRNLMVTRPNPGILDFQDAVTGPIAYDALCLFKDAFISWPEAQVAAWREDYRRRAQAAELPVGNAAEFARGFDWIGLQRHLKVLGIFARIRYRDGKPSYLEDAPRFIAYIRAVLPHYPQLGALTELFDALELA